MDEKCERQNSAPHEEKNQITIEDFRRLEIRVAQILSVEEVPRTRNLYRIKVDLGYERRTIVSSLKDFFSPEELSGRRIAVLCNLKPAKMCGVLSNGMLLAAEAEDNGDTLLALLTPDGDIPLGSRIN